MTNAHAQFVVSFLIWLVSLFMTGCEPTRTDLMTSDELFRDRQLLAMAKAAESGDTETIERLLHHGVDINAFGRGNSTVLSRAFYAKNKVAFKYLLEHGADPNALDLTGLGIIDLAASEEDLFWLDQTLQNRGDPNHRNRQAHLSDLTPIFLAIGESRVENVVLLIEHGANINQQNKVGKCPMLFAADLQEFDIALVLLRAGADFRLKDQFNRSILDRIQQLNDESVLESQRDSFRELKRLLLDTGTHFQRPDSSN